MVPGRDANPLQGGAFSQGVHQSPECHGATCSPSQVTKARDLEIMEEKAHAVDFFMHFLPGLRRSKTCQAALFREEIVYLLGQWALQIFWFRIHGFNQLWVKSIATNIALVLNMRRLIFSCQCYLNNAAQQPFLQHLHCFRDCKSSRDGLKYTGSVKIPHHFSHKALQHPCMLTPMGFLEPIPQGHWGTTLYTLFPPVHTYLGPVSKE